MIATRLDLPPPEPPFPLTQGRYEVLPGMTRLGEEAHGRVERLHFVADAALPRYLAARLEVLARDPAAVRAVDILADPLALGQALRRAFAVLAAEHPELARLDEDAVTLPAAGLRLEGALHAPGLERVDRDPPLGALAGRIAEWLSARRGLDRAADALALTVQEDWAVVHAPLGAPDRLELAHVAFPGHWDPREKIGHDFAGVHRPVAHNAFLLRSGRALVRAMVEKGPYVRFAWGVTTDGRLDHNPGVPGGAAPALPEAVLRDPAAAADHAWLRIERQTTLPLPELRRAVFTIRTWVRPVREVARDPRQRALLADALDSMDDEALAYKGLERLRAPLVAWLRAG